MEVDNARWSRVPWLDAYLKAITNALVPCESGGGNNTSDRVLYDTEHSRGCVPTSAYAQRPHVAPSFLNVRQALRLRSALSCITPSQRIRLVCRPEGILFFLIQNNLVNGCVFQLVVSHLASIESEEVWP